MKIVAVTQARRGSTRLPDKVMRKVNGISLLELHISRILKSKKIQELIVATTTREEDSAIAEIAGGLGVKFYRGSVDDVLDRFYQALKGTGADYVVRLTSDCPLIDGELIDKVVGYTLEHQLDYCSNTLDPAYPDGQDVEVFRFAALEKAWQEAKLTSEREHVTPFIWKNSTFKGGSLFVSDNFNEGFSFGHIRMTVDEPKDFEVIEKVIHALGTGRNWMDYTKYIEQHADIRSLNDEIVRNEGYMKSVKKEK